MSRYYKFSFLLLVLVSLFLPCMAKAQDDVASHNKQEEKEFMSKIRSVKGVKSSSSGLLYKIENRGKGRKPLAYDEVYVKYKGTFADGTVFDSSTESPAIFRMNALIKGMSEGLSMLGIGGKATLYIPYHLGYGEQGTASIEPCKLLIFEVELMDVYNEFD